MTACSTKGCGKPARCAIKTARPKREKMYSVIHYDERTAPKSALPYCKPCAVALLKDLCDTLIDDN
jgi:hypothetical protein